MDAARGSPRRIAAAVALACLLGAGAVAGAADRTPDARPVAGPLNVEIGIADQKASVFDDRRLLDLRLRHARISVPWDALRFPDRRHALDAWLDGARRMGAEPLITFWQSPRRTGRRWRPPSVTDFARQFRRFVRRYPDVTSYSTWNEANMCGAGLCERPALAAGYYRAMRRNCPDCQVLAADLVDQPNVIEWVRAFRRAAGVEPALWGLHGYIDANRFQTVRTRALLSEVEGEIWLTEIGGIVARRNGSRVVLPEGKAHAARATRFIFDRVARLSPRITRVYLYHWRSSTRRDSWDSAFIGSDGSRRPALRVLEQVLRETRPDL